MMSFRDQDDEDWEEDDSIDDSDEESTVPCPSCRRHILEDTPRCPYCERYISEEDRAAPKKATWVIATALVLLGAGAWWACAAFR